MGIKAKNMRTIFSIFLLKIVLGTILAVVLPIVLFFALMEWGYVLPANYSDMVARSEAEAIENTDDLYLYLENMPGFLSYLVYDSNDTVLRTNMNQTQQEQGIAYVKNGIMQTPLTGNHQYMIVERSEAFVLLQYTVKAHYVSKTLEKYLPSADITMLLLMVLLALVNSMIQVRLLAKRFQRELRPLMQVTHEISAQNLDCEVPKSKVKEIEEILQSFSDMRDALKSSLEKQWEMQRTQREQVAALAHDLKTPMTVTLGNLDLLGETELDAEQNQLLEDAWEGLEQMSDYVGLLMEMTMASTRYQYHFEWIRMAELCDTVRRKAEVLCQNKQIFFSVQGNADALEYRGDYAMLERAFMNIIRNAVEYTPENGKIIFSINQSGDDIKLEVADSGKGFSEKMLKQGTGLFAMEDESRNGEAHYGMGLYFVDSVIKKHAGELRLTNDEQLGGAKIIILLKIKKRDEKLIFS